MNDLEVWKIAKVEFESSGLLISSHGRVKNKYFEDRAIGDNGFGYQKVAISKLGEKSTKNFYIHRLVASYFLPKTKDGCDQVNHIDGDKKNNHYTNLEWVSAKTNIKHMHENGLNKNRIELKSIKILPNDIIREAYRAVKTKQLGVNQAAIKHGMPRTTLSSIVNKRTRRDVTDEVDIQLKEIQHAKN